MWILSVCDEWNDLRTTDDERTDRKGVENIMTTHWNNRVLANHQKGGVLVENEREKMNNYTATWSCFWKPKIQENEIITDNISIISWFRRKPLPTERKCLFLKKMCLREKRTKWTRKMENNLWKPVAIVERYLFTCRCGCRWFWRTFYTRRGNTSETCTCTVPWWSSCACCNPFRSTSSYIRPFRPTSGYKVDRVYLKNCPPNDNHVDVFKLRNGSATDRMIRWFCCGCSNPAIRPGKPSRWLWVSCTGRSSPAGGRVC